MLQLHNVRRYTRYYVFKNTIDNTYQVQELSYYFHKQPYNTIHRL